MPGGAAGGVAGLGAQAAGLDGGGDRAHLLFDRLQADHALQLAERLLDGDLRRRALLVLGRLGPALAHPYADLLLLRGGGLGLDPAGHQEPLHQHGRGGGVRDPDRGAVGHG
ncbi:hypothetical protein GCM10020001_019090 [Nonomuraea salmonea]